MFGFGKNPVCRTTGCANANGAVNVATTPPIPILMKFLMFFSDLRFLTSRHFFDCSEYIEHHLFACVRGRMGLVFHRFPSGASSGDYHRCFRTVGEAVELKPRLNALSVYQTREIWSFHLFLFINPGSSPRSFRAWAMALAALLRRHAGRMVSRIAW